MPPAAHANGIEARGVSRRFGAKVALEPIDFEAPPATITGLLGPNGSGKSTLLRILVGIVRPDSGSVRVAGVELSGDGHLVRRRATYAPGEIALFGEMKASEHLDWLLRGREPDARLRARELARRLELPLAARVRAFSHGMKRQLLFCAALAPRVPVRVLDEASEGLDPEKRGVMLELLLEDARSGSAIVLSSHHLGEVDRACARLYCLHKGRVIAQGSAEELGRRARRLLRLRFADRAARERAELALSQVAKVARAERERLVLELDADDPRAMLATVAQRSPEPPLGVDYGELSLAELYQSLYGVEAV